VQPRKLPPSAGATDPTRVAGTSLRTGDYWQSVKIDSTFQANRCGTVQPGGQACSRAVRCGAAREGIVVVGLDWTIGFDTTLHSSGRTAAL
jgi:hypothetical protein